MHLEQQALTEMTGGIIVAADSIGVILSASLEENCDGGPR